MKKNYNLAFTLIELLVVIAIIVTLAALSSFGLRGSFENARNTQRKSDLKQYQTALEIYANKNNGLFPSRTANSGTRASTTICSDLGLPSGDCSEDPAYENDSSWDFYKYESNGSGTGGADASDYVLWARLEEDTTTYHIVCSNGKSGDVTTNPSGNDGNCPL